MKRRGQLVGCEEEQGLEVGVGVILPSFFFFYFSFKLRQLFFIFVLFLVTSIRE